MRQHSPAWLRLGIYLHRATLDPVIAADPVVLDFAEHMRNLTFAPVTKPPASALAVLASQEWKLPKATRARQQRRDAAQQPRTPADIRKAIKAGYARRVRAGQKHGAIKALATEHGISRDTVRKYLNGTNDE